jgi:putative endonuclease
MSTFIYILRLKSGNIYIGSTSNLENRYAEHIKGTASRMTKLDPPVGIVYTETYETQLEARQREAQIKRWSRSKKEALVSGDLNRLKTLSKSNQK